MRSKNINLMTRISHVILVKCRSWDRKSEKITSSANPGTLQCPGRRENPRRSRSDTPNFDVSDDVLK